MVRFFRMNVNEFGFLCNDLILPRWHSQSLPERRHRWGGGGSSPGVVHRGCPVSSEGVGQQADTARPLGPAGLSSAVQPWRGLAGPGTHPAPLGRGRAHGEAEDEHSLAITPAHLSPSATTRGTFPF